MIPNGCVELIIHLTDQHCELFKNDEWSTPPEYTILGMHTGPYKVWFKGKVKVFAIRFKPEGIYSVFGVPASTFKETYEDMSQVLGNGFHDFCHRIKEEKDVTSMIERTEVYLLKNLRRNKVQMSYVNLAAELIRQSKGIRIEDLPGRVFISQRQLEREFKSKVGISPKHYLRITRINEVVRLLDKDHTMDLTSVAYHCGYFDQAHFINDFKKITGEKPTIFIKGRNRFIANSGLAHYGS